MAELTRLRKPVFIGGTVQVGLSVVLAAGFSLLLGMPPNRALFVGFLVSRRARHRLEAPAGAAEIEAPHGRIALSVLIFQDIVAVPIDAAYPFLAGTGASSGRTWPCRSQGRGRGRAVFVLSRRSCRTSRRVVRTKSRELFLLCTLASAWPSAT